MDHGCRGVGAARWAELLSNEPGIEFAMLDAADVRAGRLAGFDCLVMPGGGGFERYDDWGEEGCAKIREFVRGGGGYVKDESPGLQVNERMERLLRRREIKGVFSGWGGKGWVFQGTRIGTCGVISQRAEYAPLFVAMWNRIKAGADASDPALARAFSAYLYMANLGDIFSTWQDDEMRGPHLYVLERLGLFRNRLTRESGKAVEWMMTDKEKAEVDARLRYIGILDRNA